MKRRIKMFVYGYKTPQNTWTTSFQWEAFVTHKWKCTWKPIPTVKYSYDEYDPRQDHNDFISKITCLQVALSAMAGDLFIAHTLQLFYLMETANVEKWQNDKFYSQITKKWIANGSPNHQTDLIDVQTLTINKYNRCVKVLSHHGLLKHIWHWVQNANKATLNIDIAAKNNQLGNQCISLSMLILWYELANTFWQLHLCSHHEASKENTDDINTNDVNDNNTNDTNNNGKTNPKSKSRKKRHKKSRQTTMKCPRRFFAIPQRIEKWIHEAYGNKNELPYSLMYSSIFDDTDALSRKFKDGITDKMDTQIKLGNLVTDVDDRKKFMDHYFSLQMVFIIFYDIIPTALKGCFDWNFESFHVPLQKTFVTLENLLRAHYQYIAFEDKFGTIPMGKTEFIKKNIHDPSLAPEYDYIEADGDDRVEYKCKQGIDLMKHNLCNPTIKTDQMFADVLPMHIANNLWPVPLSTASASFSPSSWRTKTSKLAEVKFRGLDANSEQNMMAQHLQQNRDDCCSDVYDAYKLETKESEHQTQNVIYNTQAALFTDLEQWTDRTGTLQELCGDSKKLFKHKNVFPQKHWTINKNELAGAKRISLLLVKNKWFGNKYRWINSKQYLNINSESFKIAMHEFYKRLRELCFMTSSKKCDFFNLSIHHHNRHIRT